VTPDDFDKECERDIAWVLSTPQGRRFVHRLAHDRSLGMLRRSAYVPGGGEPLSFNAGRQALALDILAEAERVASDLFDKMMVEAHQPSRRPSRALVPPDSDSSDQ